MRLARLYHFALLGCALCGAAIVLFATQLYGIGLSPDSAGYISAARNIMRGQGVNNLWDAPLVILAPFYSMLLGFLGRVSQIDPLALAAFVNAILYGLIVYASGRVAFQFLKSPSFAFAAIAAISFSGALLLVAMMAWSETLLIFFTVLALWLAKLYLDAPRLRTLIFLAATLALAMLTRYAGMVFAIWGLWLIALTPRVTHKRKILCALIFLGIALLPLGLWALRNLLLTGTAFGGRPSSIFTLAQNLGFTFKTLALWYLSQSVVKDPSVLLCLGISIGIFCVVALKGNLAAFKKFLQEINPVLAFVLLYLGGLIVLATTTAFDRIGDRLLSPIVVPLFLLTFGFVEMGARAWREIVSPRLVAIALTLGILLWLGVTGYSTVSYVLRVRESGLLYTSQAWRTSATLAYLRATSLPNDCALVSNNPSALYLLTNRVARGAPAKAKYNSPDRVTENLERLRNRWLPDAMGCLIWFKHETPTLFFTPEELQTIANLRALATFDDGAIYLVTQK